MRSLQDRVAVIAGAGAPSLSGCTETSRSAGYSVRA